MTWDYTLMMFLVMLTAQIPLLVAAIVNYLKQQQNAKNIEKIEKATNSMKDALVAGAGREGFDAGVKSQLSKNKPQQ